MKGLARTFLAAACLLAVGCAANEADRLFETGDYAAAVAAYEARLEGRTELEDSDAPVLLRLALARSRPGTPHYDPERAERYLRRLVEELPHSTEAREAEWILGARERVAELERQLEMRDEQLTRLNAVLRLVAEAELRLRSEVEGHDEARADLESRLAALSRRARELTDEVAELESELDALKRIDMESVAQGGAPPP